MAVDVEQPVEASRLSRSHLAVSQGCLVNRKRLRLHAWWQWSRGQVHPRDTVWRCRLNRQRQDKGRARLADQKCVDLVSRRRSGEPLEDERSVSRDLLHQSDDDLRRYRLEKRGSKARGHLVRCEGRRSIVEDRKHPA
jgi:hypothetical protein